MGILSRLSNRAAEQRKVTVVGAGEAISHPADVVVATPETLRRSDEKGRFNKFMAFTGFGRSLRQSIDVTDTNHDGVCVMSIQCGVGIECTVRSTSGKNHGHVPSGDERVVSFELPAGQYNLFWKEV